MNQKLLKKTIKRQTAKKRAQRQTSRRTERAVSIRNKRQIAQDIYESLQMLDGGPKRRKGGEYRLKAYDYDMFKFGDPLKVGTAMPKAGTNKRNQAKSEIKKERKRKERWVQDIKSKKAERKKAERANRKKRKRSEAKRPKRTTSRKSKMS